LGQDVNSISNEVDPNVAAFDLRLPPSPESPFHDEGPTSEPKKYFGFAQVPGRPLRFCEPSFVEFPSAGGRGLAAVSFVDGLA